MSGVCLAAGHGPFKEWRWSWSWPCEQAVPTEFSVQDCFCSPLMSAILSSHAASFHFRIVELCQVAEALGCFYGRSGWQGLAIFGSSVPACGAVRRHNCLTNGSGTAGRTALCTWLTTWMSAFTGWLYIGVMVLVSLDIWFQNGDLKPL